MKVSSDNLPVIMRHPTVKEYGSGVEKNDQTEIRRLHRIDFYKTKGITSSNHFLPISKLLISNEEK